MKLNLKRKSKNKKLVKVIRGECFNCGHPFSGHEKFCPECGQKNKNPKITFGSFLNEVFNGFISWDSKFWTTFIPLLTKPGKVSRDYIDGKRIRYANPFRFYLTVSVLFFLILGATESYDKFKELSTGKTVKNKSINEKTDDVLKSLDTLDTTKINSSLNDALKNVDSVDRAEILKVVPELNLDSIKTKSQNSGNIQLSFFPDAQKYVNFQKKYPNIDIESALDSLKVEHTFFNRFMYSRFQAGSKIGESDENLQEFIKQFISYGSISLFILLPLFTLFLKFFYIRRKFTYVEHLIFVFHTQTVFFLLLTIFYIIYYAKNPNYIIGVFILLFLTYLFLAMKRFYRQGYIKTFIKFIFINTVFFFISTIGFTIVGIIAFAFY